MKELLANAWSRLQWWWRCPECGYRCGMHDYTYEHYFFGKRGHDGGEK